MQSKTVLQLNRCRGKRQVSKPFTHALALSRVSTESSSKRLFCFHSDSDIMRYVGGEVLNNPVTRASQSRGGGRIPRAGWLIKSGVVRRDDMAPRVINRAQSETAVLTRLGCALLQHSPRVSNDSNQRVDRGNQRRTGVDQGARVLARLLVQRPSTHRQRHPRPSGKLSLALPKLQGNSPAHKRFQGLGVKRSMPAIWSE